MAKILIVEDERPISQLIKSNLTLVGHTCQQAFDGESAVAAAWAEPFDLILLDVMLPGLSGFEVIRRIPKTPVIFVTAKKELSDRLAGLYLGGDDYIVKPFEILELLARVESVLRRIAGTVWKRPCGKKVTATLRCLTRDLSAGGKAAGITTPSEAVLCFRS